LELEQRHGWGKRLSDTPVHLSPRVLENEQDRRQNEQERLSDGKGNNFAMKNGHKGVPLVERISCAVREPGDRSAFARIDTFEWMRRMRVSLIDLSYCMSVPFSGQRPAIHNSAAMLTENCDLITTITVPLVDVGLLQEGRHRDGFMFTINDKTFQTSIVEAVLLSPAVE
jgi:hypothetical protein